jgi:hypothetical protein
MPNKVTHVSSVIHSILVRWESPFKKIGWEVNLKLENMHNNIILKIMSGFFKNIDGAIHFQNRSEFPENQNFHLSIRK